MPADDAPPERIASGQRAPVPLADRLALSVDEAAALLGISRDLMYELVASGEMPSVRLGRRIVVPKHALEVALRKLVDFDEETGTGGWTPRWAESERLSVVPRRR